MATLRSTRPAAVLITALGGVLALVAYGSAWIPGGAPWWGVASMIGGTALMLAGALALGTAGMRSWQIALACGFLVVVVGGGFGLAFFLPPDAAGAPLWWGLPRRVAIEIFGVGLLPLLLLPGLFAATFRADGLDDTALAALRAECERLRQQRDRS